jgi:heme-degrading monooxygenase HmoA
MITVANRIEVAPENAEAFERAFRQRAGHVDETPGFIRNQVLRPTREGDPYVVLTTWESRQAFEAWTRSESFKKAHANAGATPTGASRLEVHQIIQDSNVPDLEVEPVPTA